jgi:hypothetical protein
MGSVTLIGVRQQLGMALMVVAVGVAAWKALDGDWLAVIVALTALAPASLYWQFEHYAPKSSGRPVLRFSLALVAAVLVILAAAATSS